MALTLAGELTGASCDRAVVFLGALGTTRAVWDAQLSGLHAAGVPAVALDLRGLGDSPAPPGPYTIAQLAEDVLSTLDGWGVTRADIVGMSLGGAVAQYIAITTPERVATLSLLSTAARFGDRATWLERAGAVRANGTGPLAGALAGRWLTHEFSASHPDVMSRLRAMLLRTQPEGYAGCAEALAEWDSRELLGQIAAPTLLIAGAQDLSTTPETMRTLAQGIPEARFVVLDPAAHLVNVEQPDAVSALITEHLRVTH